MTYLGLSYISFGRFFEKYFQISMFLKMTLEYPIQFITRNIIKGVIDIKLPLSWKWINIEIMIIVIQQLRKTKSRKNWNLVL